MVVIFLAVIIITKSYWRQEDSLNEVFFYKMIKLTNKNETGRIFLLRQGKDGDGGEWILILLDVFHTSVKVGEDLSSWSY